MNYLLLVCLWRDRVSFTYLHNGHIGIYMMDSFTTVYREYTYSIKISKETKIHSHVVLYLTRPGIGMC